MENPIGKLLKEACARTICAFVRGEISFEEISDYFEVYIESKDDEILKKYMEEYFNSFIDVKEVPKYFGRRAQISILDDYSNLKKDEICDIINKKIEMEETNEQM